MWLGGVPIEKLVLLLGYSTDFLCVPQRPTNCVGNRDIIVLLLTQYYSNYRFKMHGHGVLVGKIISLVDVCSNL